MPGGALGLACRPPAGRQRAWRWAATPSCALRPPPHRRAQGLEAQRALTRTLAALMKRRTKALIADQAGIRFGAAGQAGGRPAALLPAAGGRQQGAGPGPCAALLIPYPICNVLPAFARLPVATPLSCQPCIFHCSTAPCTAAAHQGGQDCVLRDVAPAAGRLPVSQPAGARLAGFGGSGFSAGVVRLSCRAAA